MGISYFDIVISVIILLLGLKGLLSGFFKEIFGLIGIIGGIFVASRLGSHIGKIISHYIPSFTNQTAITFTGFVLTFAAFWLIMISIGYGFKKLSSYSGLGPLDRIFGFVVGAGKFFLIFAVILYAAYNIKIFRANIKPVMKNSILFPILLKTGGYIMKTNPSGITGKAVKDLNATTAVKAVKQQLKQITDKNISS